MLDIWEIYHVETNTTYADVALMGNYLLTHSQP